MPNVIESTSSPANVRVADRMDGGLVLVVDDNEAVRTSFAEILRAAGFDVIEAADGVKALQLFHAQDVVTMILDVGMPVLDGFAVLDRLDDPPPVVLVTAHPYDAKVMQRRDKVFGFIQKPVPPDSLIAMVDAAVAARSAS